MPSSLASHLAERFASDARALRARAGVLARAGPAPNGSRRGARVPDAAGCARMADACERARALFAEAGEAAADDEGLRALLPRLAGMVAGAGSAEERNVYAGAVARLTEALDGGDAADTDDEDEEDDE